MSIYCTINLVQFDHQQVFQQDSFFKYLKPLVTFKTEPRSPESTQVSLLSIIKARIHESIQGEPTWSFDLTKFYMPLWPWKYDLSRHISSFLHTKVSTCLVRIHTKINETECCQGSILKSNLCGDLDKRVKVT